MNRAALLVLFGVVIGAGCDRTSQQDEPPLPPASWEAIWQVTGYAQDDQGCRPAESVPQVAAMHLSLMDDEPTNERGDTPAMPQQLQFTPCPDAEHCSEDPLPEDQLTWNDHQERAEFNHHYATLTGHQRAVDNCHLSSLRTLLVSEGDQLQLRRTLYELELSLEGDQSCTDQLAAEFQGAMNCVRSEVFTLGNPRGLNSETAADPEGSDGRS